MDTLTDMKSSPALKTSMHGFKPCILFIVSLINLPEPQFCTLPSRDRKDRNAHLAGLGEIYNNKTVVIRC